VTRNLSAAGGGYPAGEVIMGIDESDITRLLAGDVASDDAQLGQVSAFLGDLKAAYPPSSVSALEDHHLAVVAREVRAVGASQLQDQRDARRPARRLGRTLAAVATGVVAVFTLGVGVASAMGLNPLDLVPGLVAKPSATPDASARTPGDPDNGQQASHDTQPPAAGPSVPATTTGQPGTPSASATHGTTGNCGNGKGAGNASCTAGNSGKDNSGNGKSKGASGKGNSGASSTSGKSGGGASNPGNGKGTPKATATPSAAPTSGNGNGKGKSKDNSTSEAGATTPS
jgi:hypothetical protein